MRAVLHAQCAIMREASGGLIARPHRVAKAAVASSGPINDLIGHAFAWAADMSQTAPGEFDLRPQRQRLHHPRQAGIGRLWTASGQVGQILQHRILIAAR